MHYKFYGHHSFRLISLGLVFIFLLIFDLILPPFYSFILKTAFLTLLIAVFVLNLKREIEKDWLLHPAILALIFTFLISFAITNYIYFIPDTIHSAALYKQLGSDPLPALNYTMTIVILSAFMMWIGYRTGFGDRIYNFLLGKPLWLERFFRSELNPRMTMIFVLIIISVLARLYAIELGVFGYAQSEEKLSENIAIAYSINALGQLIDFSLILVAIKFFREGLNFNYRVTLTVIVLVEIYFGIISGMKSAVVFPVLTLFICYYFVHKKINKSFIVAAVVLLVFAYMIIEPFRMLRTKDVHFESSPGYIIGTMTDAYQMNKSRQLVYDSEDVFTSIIARNNYLLNAAKAIDYKNNRGLDTSDPDFLEKIYTVPLQTFIPRAIWLDKPVEDFGMWFSYKVWGGTRTTSVAMTPIGFLYFAGGVIAVLIGFFVFGVAQKIVWNFYLAGGGQLLIYFGFLSTVVLIDSSVNGTLVYWLRNLPIFILVQALLLKK